MSIISEALKKAEKQARLRTPSMETVPSAKSEEIINQRQIQASKGSKEANIFLALAISGIVVSAAILGSIVLFRNLNLTQVTPEIQKLTSSEVGSDDSYVDSPEPEKRESIIELNGIVYESKERWAIINNKIVRLGDTVGDERIVEIGKDYVRLVNELNKVEKKLTFR